MLMSIPRVPITREPFGSDLSMFTVLGKGCLGLRYPRSLMSGDLPWRTVLFLSATHREPVSRSRHRVPAGLCGRQSRGLKLVTSFTWSPKCSQTGQISVATCTAPNARAFAERRCSCWGQSPLSIDRGALAFYSARCGVTLKLDRS